MISTRVSTIRPSATLAVDARAKELRGQGVDVVSFAAGEPDFATPPHIVDAAAAATRDAGMHKYSPAAGLPELRQAVAEESNTTVDGVARIGAENVAVTNGAKQAIFSVFATILEPGDEVLLPVPFWTTYPELVGFFGGTAIPVPSRSVPGDLPSVDDLEACVGPRTKALVWCSPANPSGAVADEQRTRAVFDWAEQRGLWIVSDEIYRKLHYAPGPLATMRALGCPGYERLVVIDGVSKAYAMTGWRVGWVIGDAEFVRCVVRLQSHMASNVGNVAQAAALAALTGPQGVVDDMVAAFARRRALVIDRLDTIGGLSLLRPTGGFYAFPDVTEAARLRGIDNTRDLALRLLDDVNVAVVPGEAFGMPGHIRLSYALSDERIEAGLDRIAAYLG